MLIRNRGQAPQVEEKRTVPVEYHDVPVRKGQGQAKAHGGGKAQVL